MAVEKYVAAASLGLFVIFVGEIITLYDFMIEPQREVEPAPKVLQFISIGVAPAVVYDGKKIWFKTSRCYDTCRGCSTTCGNDICIYIT